MGTRFYIAPRRLILIAITLIGLLLRTWGLSWGRELVVHNPEEWAWRVVDHLSMTTPVYPGLFNQAFYSLAALFHNAVCSILGLAGLLFGQTRFISEAAFSSLITARLLAALFSSGQILLAYILGRRCFNSVGTGMFAAALVACSPVLVANGHSMSVAPLLAFMILVCMLLCLMLISRATWRGCLLVGLAGGLTTTVHSLGLGVWPLLFGAFVLAIRRHKLKPVTYLLFWPSMGLLGLAIGLVAGCPGLATPEFWQSDTLTTLLPSTPAEGWFRLVHQNLFATINLLSNVGGLAFAGLWLASVGLCVRRSASTRLLVAATPIPFMILGLLGLADTIPMFVSSWLAAACVSAGWPLVRLCRMPDKYGRQLALAFTIAILICITPLWRSMGLAYLFWQQDTFSCAVSWLSENKPGQTELLAGPGTPQDIFPKANSVGDTIDTAKAISSGAYVLRIAGRGNYSGLQKVAHFDLCSLWYPLDYKPLKGFPDWLSPPVDIYGPARLESIRRPLALIKPGTKPQRGYDLIHTASTVYGRSNQSMLVGPGSWRQRVIRGDQSLDTIAVDLRNLGRDLAVVQVRQGLRWAKSYSIFPGQEAEVIFNAASWPPMLGGLQPVKVRLLRGDKVLARIEWDPLIIGRLALEKGNFDLARQMLLKAVKRYPGSFDAAAMLAGSLAALNRLNAAALVLEAISGLNDHTINEFMKLASAPAGPAWDAELQRLTGYDARLLRRAVVQTYAVGGPICRSEGEKIPFEGEGYSGVMLSNDEGGFIKVWLNNPVPRGNQSARLELILKDPKSPIGKLAVAEVWGHGPEGSTLLAKHHIDTADFKDNSLTIDLPFVTQKPGAKLEIDLNLLQKTDLRFQQLHVGVDLRGHLRGVLRWLHDANGLVHLEQGRYPEAVKDFEAILKIDPGFTRAYIPLAKSLIDAGQTKRAAEVVQRAEELFRGQPDMLTEVRARYQALRMDTDAARVEKSLADLRPSLKFESRFEGGLALLGYDMPQNKTKPGGVLDVNYYWRIWAKPPTNYFVFVHLEGQGRVVNYDHMLDHGRVSMTSLKTGQVIRENFQIKIPGDLPLGKYNLVVGLWDPKFTGKGMNIIDGRGKGGKELVLTTITVEKPKSPSTEGSP